MKSYSTFIFDSYTFDPENGQIELKYSLDDEIYFIETLRLPKEAKKASEANEALFALHLIGGISYYKTCLPKKIEIRSGSLNQEQAHFWNTVYEKGLGEFWYKNGIDFGGLVKFPVSTECKSGIRKTKSEMKKVLIPIGGGKDSIVTTEILRKDKPILFRMNAHPLINEIARTAGLPLLTVERRLDPHLFELNAQGALNGHIPITAYVSCLSTVVATLYGFNSIAMSCERSASEGNVEYLGTHVNHQWSKGEEFEKTFQEYIQTFINPNLRYWSPIRHMTELEIVEKFSNYPQYFHCTTSCNRNWKLRNEKLKMKNEKLFCGTCPKCAFVFALYAAYLPKKTVLAIFGDNLFEKKELTPIYRQLLGTEGCKPFECVGTPEETRKALILAEKNGFLTPTHAYS